MTAVLDRCTTDIAPLAEVSGTCVPLPSGAQCRYANFDYAASAPVLAQVGARIGELVPTYASVHRGAGYASQVSTDAYEQARVAVAEFVGARTGGGPGDDVVVFTRNTTDSLNLLAACVPGDVVVLDVEHHANLLPWKNSRVVVASDTIEETIRSLVGELCSRPAALLAVTGASNVTGEILPVARLAEIAHACGARILVDAAQLAPHRRIDLAASGIDYLAFSGHKLYAPFGAGVLVGRRDWLDAAAPYLAGGGAVRDVTLDHTEWAASPARHEAGTPNLFGAAGLAAACEALTDIGFDEITRHEAALTAQLTEGLRCIDGVRLLRLWSDAEDSVGIVTFTVDGVAPREVAAYLADHGIGVRDGRFCAHPVLNRLGLPGGAVRASLGLGTGSEDVRRLVDALAELATRGGAHDGAERVTGGTPTGGETR
ncbi:aminotransferase class V-fold PLP-dependent enzyme [Rhodococcus triatomae]|uniref:Selenocysteine lyase/Cysteine desulfurase n=1 Tax=Rhodococcus triatomae TaxID=300028 RepID=A0A1G8S130_9NOCA|nr:aminotransferase class V-fold PLP-dependent enzyme [Rhodococcus triatomae]QNG17348.1 aminotransferase class V-fold PLP-dependent enzyme [Rhodococcus triatomae]QNG22985.1 aminotransferase class V-fold PLP-dependent enzyme [Rhodococcus triatomae]SDJ22938.1 Selenocysteine lyase/Cysteine desulfurase [Rhodococcus triatomae]